MKKIFFLLASISFFFTASLFSYTIREGLDIPEREKELVQTRMKDTLKSKSTLLGSPIPEKKNPKIGLASSGGGPRAAIVASAFYYCLHKILDYWVALSGSTWFLAQAVTYTKNTPEELKKILARSLSIRFPITIADSCKFAVRLLEKKRDGLPITLTDYFSLFLYAKFLKEKENQQTPYIHFSDIAKKISDGSFRGPFPIVTTAIRNTDPMVWAEITPLEMRLLRKKGRTNYWVPTPASNMFFDRGNNINDTPEMPLQELLAMCGAAFAVPYSSMFKLVFDSIIQYLKQKISPTYTEFDAYHEEKRLRSTYGEELLQDLGNFSKIPCRAGILPNFMKNISTCPFAELEKLEHIDAGILSGMPAIDLFCRNVEIIIIAETSSGSKILDAKYLIQQAKRLEYPMPKITKGMLKQIDNHEPILIFDKKRPELPIIVYFSLPETFSTIKFEYTQEEFDLLFNQTLQKVVTNIDLIRQAIRLSIEN